MAPPVSAWTWNPYGNYEPPSTSPGNTSSPPATTRTTDPASGTSFSPSYVGYTGRPPSAGVQTGSPLLPSNLLSEGRTLGSQIDDDPERDPHADIINFSRLARDVDGQVDDLANQSLDVETAQGQFAAADARHVQWLQQFYGGLNEQQLSQLRPLATAAQTEGPQQAQAVTRFTDAVNALLTPEQRQTLLGLTRAREDAQMNLQGAQIGQRIRVARSHGTGEDNTELSLALADGRAFVANRMLVQADRKLQDAYAIALTPEAQQRLVQPRRELTEAQTNAQQNPSDTGAQERLRTAQEHYDTVFASVVNPQDGEAIKGFEAHQRQMQSLAGTLGDEAGAERNYYQLREVVLNGTPTQQQLRQYDLVRADFELTKHNRNMRSLALRAADNDDLNGELDQAMLTSLRMNADLNVRHRQFDLETLQNEGNQGTVTLASYPGAATSPVGGADRQQAITQAQRLLDAARQDQHDLLEQLENPPQPKRSWWDRALEIVAGVGEIIGGVFLMATCGWTGIGAVAGGAIVIDGVFRLGHSIADAANGTTTDTPQSRLFQTMGASRDTANRIDMGVNLAATLPVGGYGAGLTAVKSANMVMSGSRLAGTAALVADGAGVALMVDGGQAQARYVATGEHVMPWTVEQMVAQGMDPLQANYVIAIGGFISGGAGARFRRAPTTVTEPAPTVTLAATRSGGGSTTTASPLRAGTVILERDTANVPGSLTIVRDPQTILRTTQGPATPLEVRTVVGNGRPPTAGAVLLGTDPVASPSNLFWRITDSDSGALSLDPQPALQTNRVYRNSTGSGESGQGNPTAGTGANGGTTGIWGRNGGTGSVPPTPALLVHGSQPPTDVAILGGGNVGITLAADIVYNTDLKPTVLFRGDGLSGADRITPVVGTYTFNETLYGVDTFQVSLGPEHFGYSGARAGMQAMQEARTIVVTLPDRPPTRLALFNMLQESGLANDPSKTIVLIRGGQAGQPVLSNIIRNDPNWRASVVLVEDSPYGTRGGGAESKVPFVINAKRKNDVEISVLGEGGNQAPGLYAMREMFPLGERINKPSWPDFDVVPGSEMPWRAGYFIHPGPAFDPVNLQRTRAGDEYLHYSEGIHPALGEQLGRIDQERVRLAQAYGAPGESFPQKLERQFGLEYRPGEPFYQTMQRTTDIYKSTAYPSIDKLMGSRYPQEDVPAIFTMNWYARRAGLDLPETVAFEAQIRATLSELGVTDEQMRTDQGGYLPFLDTIEGGVPEIVELLNQPHAR